MTFIVENDMTLTKDLSALRGGVLGWVMEGSNMVKKLSDDVSHKRFGKSLKITLPLWDL